MSITTLNEKTNAQFTLSHDLLYLLQWIIENEQDKLKRLVVKALHHGIYEQMQELDTETQMPTIDEKNDLYASIIDFFALMEAFLQEASRDYVKKKAREQNLLQSIDHIMCDDDILQSSLERATKKSSSSTTSQAKEVLFQEILKRWAPASKKSIN